ncbi:MAG: biopolymer transporter ExbD [Verrucomicrobiota bacterium]|nr:biopolymer transporter ExbD [Verrucomicrobiota bacterium]
MRFTTHKRRTPPTIIIISLIDILIVLLIFLMVTTTFKQTPALKLALPESKQPKQGGSPDAGIIVTIAKNEPHIFLDTRPVTLDRLQGELAARVAKNPKITLSIRADTEAPWGQIIRVMDAAKGAKIERVNAFTKAQGQR